jgi:hypothetical protein
VLTHEFVGASAPAGETASKITDRATPAATDGRRSMKNGRHRRANVELKNGKTNLLSIFSLR